MNPIFAIWKCSTPRKAIIFENFIAKLGNGSEKTWTATTQWKTNNYQTHNRYLIFLGRKIISEEGCFALCVTTTDYQSIHNTVRYWWDKCKPKSSRTLVWICLMNSCCLTLTAWFSITFRKTNLTTIKLGITNFKRLRIWKGLKCSYFYVPRIPQLPSVLSLSSIHCS